MLDELLLLQQHSMDPTCPCSLRGERQGEIGEWCEPKHLRTVLALARETAPMDDDPQRLEVLQEIVQTGLPILHEMEHKLCGGTMQSDVATWARSMRKKVEGIVYSSCPVHGEEAEGEPIEAEDPVQGYLLTIERYMAQKGQENIAREARTLREEGADKAALRKWIRRWKAQLRKHLPQVKEAFRRTQETGLEHGVVFDGNPQVLTGGPSQIRFPDEAQGKPTFHTHPSGVSVPSEGDFRDAEENDRPWFCFGYHTGSAGEIKCYGKDGADWIGGEVMEIDQVAQEPQRLKIDDICNFGIALVPRPGTRGAIVDPLMYFDCLCNGHKCAIIPMVDEQGRTSFWTGCGRSIDGKVQHLTSSTHDRLREAEDWVIDYCEDITAREGEAMAQEQYRMELTGPLPRWLIRELGKCLPRSRFAEVLERLRWVEHLPAEGGAAMEQHEKETPIEQAVAEAKAVLREKEAERESLATAYKELERIAQKYNIPYDRLIRESMKEFVLRPLDETFEVVYAGEAGETQEESPIILAPDEAAIPGFGEKFERCVMHLKPAEEKGLIRNAYAVCRASLRRAHGLPPVTKPEYGLEES
jgi:hypothetical protein